MPDEPLTEADLADWDIVSNTEGFHTFRVRAVYPKTEEKLPGWTLLKDHNHKTVAMVWNGSVILLRRVGPPMRDWA